MENQLIYSTVLYHVFDVLEINALEYLLCDNIRQLSHSKKAPMPGWCSKSKANLAKTLRCTERNVFKMLDKLEEKQIIERNQHGFLRTTAKWDEAAVFQQSKIEKQGQKTSAKKAPSMKKVQSTQQSSYEQSSGEPMKKVHSAYEQSSGEPMKKVHARITIENNSKNNRENAASQKSETARLPAVKSTQKKKPTKLEAYKQAFDDFYRQHNKCTPNWQGKASLIVKSLKTICAYLEKQVEEALPDADQRKVEVEAYLCFKKIFSAENYSKLDEWEQQHTEPQYLASNIATLYSKAFKEHQQDIDWQEVQRVSAKYDV